MSSKSFFIAFIYFFYTHSVFAQNISFEIKFPQNLKNQAGNLLVNGWAGGINAPQFASIHLDEDAQEDLIVFDKTSNKLSTFLAVSSANGKYYQYAPQYESLFPDLLYYCLTADYDRDGRKDLFTYSTKGGLKVYRNTKIAGQNLSFALAADPVNTYGYSGIINLLVPATDIPALIDIDEDGDLDIITYEFYSGSLVEYHQNQSIEKYGNANTLEFKRVSNCWGGYYEGATCGDFTFNLNCKIGPSMDFGGAGSELLRVMHVGSSILVIDLNGDGKKDLLVGDVSCNNIYSMMNQGTSTVPSYTSFDTNFPSSKPINFQIFPAVFFQDLDFDGIKDLVAAPNVFRNEGNLVNFQQSAWFYKNTGTDTKPNFQFVQSDFLQNTMLDLGENAFPAMADYDGDGDLDLLVGNKGLLQNNNSLLATVVYLQNTGTSQNPSFQIQDNDFLKLSSMGFTDIKPQWMDINQDGSLDFIFTATLNNQSQLYYILNQNPSNQAFLLDITQLKTYNAPLEYNDNPYLFDLNKDGKLDLLLGKNAGNLAYYENKGTALSPQFSLVTDTLGGITAYPFRRNLCPIVTDIDLDSQPDLLTSDNSGTLTVYLNFKKNLGNNFPNTRNIIVDTLQQKLISKSFGSTLFLCNADFDKDGFQDVVLGSNAGGLFLLKNTSDKQFFDNSSPDATLLIYPNPVMDQLSVRCSIDAVATIYNTEGKVILNDQELSGGFEKIFSMNTFSSGTYIIQAIGRDGQKLTKRFVVQK